MAVSDRVEALIVKRVDAVLDDTRRSLDDVRMKLWVTLGAPKGPDASGSGMTIKEGMPVPADNGRVTGRIEILKDGEIKLESNFNIKKLAAIWSIGKWVLVALAAGGGVAGLVKLLAGLNR